MNGGLAAMKWSYDLLILMKACWSWVIAKKSSLSNIRYILDQSKWMVSDTHPLVSEKMSAFGSLLFCSLRAILDFVFLDMLVDLELNSYTNLATMFKIYPR